MRAYQRTVGLQPETRHFNLAPYDECFNGLLAEHRGANLLAVGFARMLLAEGCLSTERCFLVECDQAAEKGSFSERALQDSCKHTLREASFISYANLDCT